MSNPYKVYMVLLSVFINWEIAHTQDTSVCNFTTLRVPPPPPKLSPSYSTTIEWKNVNTNSTMVVKEYFNGIQNIGSQDIYMDQKFTKVLYDNKESQYFEYNKDSGCIVTDLGSFTFLDDKVWISAFNVFYGVVDQSIPVFIEDTTVRNMTVRHWQTCLYIVQSKITAQIDFYFTNNWKMSHASSQIFIPVRFEVLGSVINGSSGAKMPFHVIGDFFNFDPQPDLVELQTHMQLPAGVFCFGRKSSTPVNPLPGEFSILFEVVDNKNRQITYEHIWYNNVKKLIRRDYKKSDNTDPDATTEIFDFNLGILYKLDPGIGSCSEAELLQLGDDYVSPDGNNTIRMISTIEFFHLKHSQIQYVGYRTTRGVLCDVWVGTFLDPKTNINNTIEWYFNKKYAEAVGGAISYSSLTRMDIWEGQATQPIIRNVLQLDSEAPTQDKFSVGLCYKKDQRIRVLIHLRVVNGSLSLVSDEFLKERLHVQLTSLALLPPLRMTDVRVSLVGDSDVYFDGSLLAKAPFINQLIVPKPKSQHGLKSAFNFLQVGVSDQPYIYVLNTSSPPIVLQALASHKLDYMAEFTTRPTIPPTPLQTPPTPDVVPPTIQPEIPTTYATPDIVTPSTPTPVTQINKCTCPVTTKCPTQAPITCPTTPSLTPKCTCPNTPCPSLLPSTKCPSPSPCPVVTCPTQKACSPKICPLCTQSTVKCPVNTPPTSSPAPPATRPSGFSSSSTGTTNQSPNDSLKKTGNGNSGAGLSKGGITGLAIAMVIVGFFLGVLLIRIYQRVTKHKDPEERNFFTKYLADDANY